MKILLFLSLILISVHSFAIIPQNQRNALMALYDSSNGETWKNNRGWGGEIGTECRWFGITCDSTNSVVNELVLDANELTGHISDTLNQLSDLTELDLSANHLSGVIPKNVGQLTNVLELNLAYNQLSGTIPDTFGQLASLESLQLYNNQLTGNIPNSLAKLKELSTLDLHSNQLSGSIPNIFNAFFYLFSLDLSNNRFSGTIPVSFGEAVSLQFLYLDNNQLSGEIPSALIQIQNLEALGLSKNQLTGSIPSSLGQLTQLKTLWLSNNLLTGTIPSELGNINGLFGEFAEADLAFFQSLNLPLIPLSLYGNKLVGPIPEKLQTLLSEEDLSQPTKINRLPFNYKPIGIIVAGKDEANPDLTKSVNIVSNFAYRTLRLKEFPIDNILYFNYQKDQNPDKQGGNDVYAEPSKKLIEQALTQWAPERIGENQPLFLYMVGHGLPNHFVFGLSNTQESELLSATELDSWLDNFQATHHNPVIVIYDACYSGSFLTKLKATDGQKRINIASAEANKLAFFGASGQTSFSFMFWANTQKGQDIQKTFTDTLKAMRSMSANSQKPQLDDNADGFYSSKNDGNYAKTLSIGQDGITAAALPIITTLKLDSTLNNKTQLNISAGVNYPTSLIRRVWVSIISPTLAKNTDALVAELSEFELNYNAANKQYEGKITGLNQNGQYQIVAFAALSDGTGLISLPKLAKVTVVHDNLPIAEVRENNGIEVFIPNANFDSQGYEALLKIVDTPPEGIIVELVTNSLTLTKVENAISAIVEKTSLDITLPSINVANKNYRAGLKFLTAEPSLRWQLIDLVEN